MLDRQLVVFLAVVERGSFTKAGEQLGLSTSRVSQLVTQLEQQLGTTLLQRSTRRLRLTDSGERYFNECKRASTILQQAKVRLDDEQTRVAGKIRINSVGGIFAERVLAKALSLFITRYPKIEISLDFSSNRVNLLAENYDLVFRMGELEDSALIARTMMTVRTYVAASPDYFAQFGRPEHPSALKHHQCLCGSIKKWRFVHSHSSSVNEVEVTGPMASPNGYVLRQGALAGLGIVRLNHWYLDDLLSQGLLEPVFADWTVPALPLSMVYQQTKYQSKRIRLLVDFMTTYLAQNDVFSVG